MRPAKAATARQNVEVTDDERFDGAYVPMPVPANSDWVNAPETDEDQHCLFCGSDRPTQVHRLDSEAAAFSLGSDSSTLSGFVVVCDDCETLVADRTPRRLVALLNRPAHADGAESELIVEAFLRADRGSRALVPVEQPSLSTQGREMAADLWDTLQGKPGSDHRAQISLRCRSEADASALAAALEAAFGRAGLSPPHDDPEVAALGHPVWTNVPVRASDFA